MTLPLPPGFAKEEKKSAKRGKHAGKPEQQEESPPGLLPSPTRARGRNPLPPGLDDDGATDGGLFRVEKPMEVKQAPQGFAATTAPIASPSSTAGSPTGGQRRLSRRQSRSRMLRAQRAQSPGGVATGARMAASVAVSAVPPPGMPPQGALPPGMSRKETSEEATEPPHVPETDAASVGLPRRGSWLSTAASERSLPPSPNRGGTGPAADSFATLGNSPPEKQEGDTHAGTSDPVSGIRALGSNSGQGMPESAASRAVVPVPSNP